jgi:hypothetical protein
VTLGWANKVRRRAVGNLPLTAQGHRTDQLLVGRDLTDKEPFQLAPIDFQPGILLVVEDPDLTSLTLEVSVELKVLVSVEPLTSAEKPQPLKPALADTDSGISLPDLTVMPSVVFSIWCGRPYLRSQC